MECIKTMIDKRSSSTCANKCAKMDDETVVNAEKLQITVSDELPILIERPHYALSSTNDYINLLIRTYESQIQYLKDELRRKDDIINNLFDIKKQTRDSKSCLCTADSNQSYVSNMDKSVNNEKPSYEWQYPRRYAKNLQQSELPPLETANRYVDLQLNEWTKEENSESSEDVSTNDSPRKNRIKRRGNKRIVTIMGDSMVKDVKQWSLQKSTPNSKVFSKTFPGACTADMKDYVKPSMKHEPHLAILHTGTNDLRFEKSPSEIAGEIIDLGVSLKTPENEIVISSIIIRGDKLNSKATTVNEILYKKCSEKGILFLDNSNILLEHIQRGGHWGGIHLNERGTEVLKQNFIDFIDTVEPLYSGHAL